MANISLTNNSIYSQKINNFSGELFRVGGQRTPFLSATGGLNGGKVLQSTFWQIQAADSAVVSTEPTKGQEGAQPTEYLGRDRVAFTGVTQVFHKGVKMTYTAMATYQHQNPFDLSANIAASSDGDGTVTAADKLGLAGGNPIVDEFSEQMSLALEKVAREVEWFAFNGTFADGANVTPGAGTREMRGISEYTSLNANSDNTVAPVATAGNIYWNKATGNGATGANQVLSWDAIAGSLKRLYDAHAPMVQPVLCVTPKQLLDLNKELVNNSLSGTLGTIVPRDRNIAGIDVDTIVTPFGSIGMMVIDPNIMPDNNAFILDFAFIQPVFTNIPGYGTVFVRDLDQDDYARVGKAIYMEMGYDFGPPSYHLKIAGVA
ncbi:MAG: hypothetical protein CL508_05645 [Actinobacteria bacterium]|nr:hypothetical protein [Actinomycetota bacterium]|tara:strand:+ start:1618 stop:2742 length:1125 start_codon:yes stop_codon:yes gene_type:complete